MEHQAGLYEAYVKRLLDLVLSAVALLLLSPVILLVAILVRCNLGAPVIFCINPFISPWLGKDWQRLFIRYLYCNYHHYQFLHCRCAIPLNNI